MADFPNSSDSAVRVTDIPWHPDPPSYQNGQRPSSYSELVTLTELELQIEDWPDSAIAYWILDLITEREALRVALHATMDELHEAQVLITKYRDVSQVPR